MGTFFCLLSKQIAKKPTGKFAEISAKFSVIRSPNLAQKYKCVNHNLVSCRTIPFLVLYIRNRMGLLL